MATGKSIGTVQVSVGNVRLVDTNGNLRDATYNGEMFEGEQIYSDDANALFQIKYAELPEATAYDGIFRVLADGSVISGLDGNENMFGDDIDFMETAAGNEGAEGSSAFLEEVPVDESSLLGFGRDADEAGFGDGEAGLGDESNADPFNDQPEVANVTVGDGEALVYESMDANGEDGTANDVETSLTGTLVALDDDANDTHVFDTSELVVTSTDVDPSAISVSSFTLTNNEHGDDTPNSADFEIVGNFNALGAGEKATLTFTYTATDDNSLVNQPNQSDVATYTIIVTGTNDQPIVSNISFGSTYDNDSWFAQDNGLTIVGYDNDGSVVTPTVNDGGLGIGEGRWENSQVNDEISFQNGRTAESISFEFDTTYNSATVELSSFHGGRHSSEKVEWTAYNNGEVVDSGVFSAPRGTDTSSFTIRSGVDFDSISVQPPLDWQSDSFFVKSLSVANVVFETFTEYDVPGVDDTANEPLTSITGIIDTVTDDDVNDTHTYEVVAGSIMVNGEVVENSLVNITNNEGVWQYTVEGDFNYLNANELATVTFDYVAIDDSGVGAGDAHNESSVSEPATISVQIVGTNDQPIVYNEVRGIGGEDSLIYEPRGIGGEDSSLIYETTDMDSTDSNNDGILRNDEGSTRVVGSLMVSDADDDATHTFRQVNGSESSSNSLIDINSIDIDVNSNGSYSMRGDFTSLAAGETATITFQYVADDNVDSIGEASTSEPKIVSITITGTNDQPVVENINLNDASYNNSNWQDADNGISISAYDFRGRPASVNYDNEGLGVNSPGRDMGEIEDGWSGSEAIVFDFDSAMSSVTMELANIGNHYSSEEVQWIAYKDGVEVDRGSYETPNHNHTSTRAFTIDPDTDFDSLRVEPMTGNGQYDNFYIKSLDVSRAIYETNSEVDVIGVDDTSSEAGNTFSGVLTATDEDANDTPTFNLVQGSVEVNDVSSQDVSVVVNQDGTYNVSGDFGYLAAGETAVVTFDYVANDNRYDANGEPSQSEPKTLTMTISGTNDKPVITDINANGEASNTYTYTNNDDMNIPENGSSGMIESYIEVGDNATIEDLNVQLDLTHTWDGDLEISLIAPDGTQIMLSNNRGGSSDNFIDTVFDDEADQNIASGSAPFNGTFSPDGDLSVLDGMDTQGTWTLRIDDQAGGDAGMLDYWSLHFNTANGGEVIYESHDYTDVPNVEDTQEDVSTTFTGVIDTVVDADVNDTHSYEVVDGTVMVNGVLADPSLATVSFNETTQNWEYTVQGDFNYLTVGERATVTFDYVAIDSSGVGSGDANNENSVSEPATIRVTFTGTNDQPIVTDIDANNGSAVYESHDAVDFIGADDTKADVLTTFTGVINTVTDDDANDTHTYELVDGSVMVDGVAVDSSMVEVSFNQATQNWEYTVQGDFNYMDAGQNATVTFEYVAVDSSGVGAGDANNETSVSEPATVTLVLTGTNDQPVIESVTTDNIMEPNLTGLFDIFGNEIPEDSLISGQLSEVVSDDDANSTYSFVEQGSYNFGQWAPVFANVSDTNGVIDSDTFLKLDADGSYKVYNPDFNNLGAGENVTVSFDVQVTDGTNDANGETGVSEAKTVTFTVSGTNDQPVAHDVRMMNHEALGDNVNNIYGNFAGSDEDSNDLLTYDVISMDRNEPISDIVGANGFERVYNVLYDADGNGAYEGNVDIAVKLPNGVNLSDIDITGIKVLGGQFLLEGDFNALPRNESLVVKFLYNATDDSGVGAGNAYDEASVSDLGMVTLRVVGTNDVAQLSGDTAGGIHEDSLLVEDGQLIISDLDAGEAHYQTTYNFEAGDSTYANSLGVFSIAADGRWTYQLDHANHGAEIQALNAGTVTEVFTVYAADGTEQQVTITIEGSNDAPTITSSVSGATVTENDVIDGVVTDDTVLADIDATDVDNSPLTYSIIGGNSAGYFEINADGEITLSASGESAIAASLVNDQTFDLAVEVSDGVLSDTTTVSIVVDDNFVDIPTIDLPASMDSGISDSDNLTNVNNPVLDLGNIATDALQVSIIDASSEIQAQASRSSVTGIWMVNNNGAGALSYSAGEWTFTPDSNLADGPHTYTVVVVDDAGNEDHTSLSLNIDAAAPTIDTSSVADSVNETLTHIGQVVAADANGPVTFAVSDTNFVIDADGNLSFAVDANGVPLLSDYEDATSHSVMVTATDSAGNTSTETVNFDVNNVTGNVEATLGGQIVLHTFDSNYWYGWYTGDSNDGWSVRGGEHDGLSGRGALGWFDGRNNTASHDFSLDDQAGQTVTIKVEVDLDSFEGNDEFVMSVYDGHSSSANDLLATQTTHSDGTMSLDFVVPNDGDFKVVFSTDHMENNSDAWKIDNFEIIGQGEKVLSFDSPTEGTIDLSSYLAQDNDTEGGTADSIDTIDLNEATSLNISIEDVLDVANNNELRITSDGGDDNSVTLDANITQVADQSAAPDGFTTYEGSNGTETVLLTIEDNITVEY
nr:VCBS domain-containing protein [uncultured Sulfurimonas sp.]